MIINISMTVSGRIINAMDRDNSSMIRLNTQDSLKTIYIAEMVFSAPQKATFMKVNL
jgi:hypothetical protein